MNQQGTTTDRSVRLALIAIAVMVVGSLVLMWSIGLFDLDDADSGSRLAAALGLVGSLIAAAVAAVGALLRHSIDRRTVALQEEAERRAQIEVDRQAELAREAEARLRTEAVLGAVKLLGTDSGDPAPATQQAGALIALQSLNEFALSVSLLAEAWPNGFIGAEAAKQIIDGAIGSGSPATQKDAAAILSVHAEQTFPEEGRLFYAPSAVENWDLEVDVEARRSLMSYLTNVGLVLAQRLPDGGSEHTSGSIAWVIGAAHCAYVTDDDPVVRGGLIRLITALAGVFAGQPDDRRLFIGNRAVAWSDIRTAAESAAREGAPETWSAIDARAIQIRSLVRSYRDRQ